MKYTLMILLLISLESCERERQRQLRDGVASNQNLSRTWLDRPEVETPPLPAHFERPQVENPGYPARRE